MSTLLNAAGPGITQSGELIKPERWISIRLNDDQVHSLSRLRTVELTQKQKQILGIDDKRFKQSNVADLFAWKGCTCGPEFWGIWEFKEIFSFNIKQLERYKDRIKSNSVSEIKPFNYVDWMSKQIIMSLDGQLYLNGKEISQSEAKTYLKKNKSYSIVKASPYVLNDE